MPSIAQQLKINKFPFEIKNSEDQLVYIEQEDGYWERYEYDDFENRIYMENSNDYWEILKIDFTRKESFFHTSDGYRAKKLFNDAGVVISEENSETHNLLKVEQNLGLAKVNFSCGIDR